MKSCFSLAFSAILLAGATSTHASVTIGVGNGDCGTVIKAGGEKIPEDAVDWASGYLTALSMTEPASSPLDDRIKASKRVSIRSALESFCKRFPLRTFDEAAWDVYKQLGGQRNLR
jgi:hypothetical protein